MRRLCDYLKTLLGLTSLLLVLVAAAADSPADLAPLYAREVNRWLEVPAAEQSAYGMTMEDALRGAQIVPSTGQYVVLVDRNPNVQAVVLFWRSTTGNAVFIGASPTSTGKPGGFEHFKTPIGVFNHSLANLDFRAEGTKNERGVCGYGAKGMRVFDFGWVPARQTWGRKAASVMRLPIHSTDARLLEPRLGTAQSKGLHSHSGVAQRVHRSLRLLDADYEQAIAAGQTFWVLRRDRTPTPWSGRYLVVVDSAHTVRPAWSPLPLRQQ